MERVEINCLIAAKKVMRDYEIETEIVIALKEYENNIWTIEVSKRNEDDTMEEIEFIGNIVTKRKALTFFTNLQVKYFGHELPSTEIVEKK